MRLRDFLEPSGINLDLRSGDRDEALRDLVGLLALGDRPSETILRQLARREAMGSTGLGGGLAIPHCRTLAVTRLRVAFGRHRTGIDYGAPDGKPVFAVFLIVAPPMEVSNQYLPVLGRLAQLLHDPAVVEQLRQIETPDELLALADAKGL